jgi:hypothetical protein
VLYGCEKSPTLRKDKTDDVSFELRKMNTEIQKITKEALYNSYS